MDEREDPVEANLDLKAVVDEQVDKVDNLFGPDLLAEVQALGRVHGRLAVYYAAATAADVPDVLQGEVEIEGTHEVDLANAFTAEEYDRAASAVLVAGEALQAAYAVAGTYRSHAVMAPVEFHVAAMDVAKAMHTAALLGSPEPEGT